MRVLMITDFYHPYIGGVEKHVRSLGAGLVERGHHVAVATLGRQGLPDVEVDQEISVYRIRGTTQRMERLFKTADRTWAPPFPDPELARGLQLVAERESPDIVHGHDWLVRSFLPVRPLINSPLVVSLHYHTLTCAKKSLMHFDAPCDGPRLQKCVPCVLDHYGAAKGTFTLTGNRLFAAVERRTVDLFLPVSSATARSNGLVGSDVPFEVVPNFIPSVLGPPGDDLDTYLRQLPAGPFLLFVGDLRREKGLNVLLRAYAALNDAPPLILIGKVWPDTPRELPPNVFMFKNWPNYAVMEAWRRSLIGLVPSIWPEPCATVVLEAMASGKPVIATGVGGNPEMVVDGETGIIVPPEDHEALAEAIARLLSDSTLVERMGRAGADRVREFQSDTVVARIEQIYETLIARNERAAPCSLPAFGAATTSAAASSDDSTREKKPHLVSIIVNNYNYGRFLRDAIESALNQTYPHTEVIVVDDGSTDESRQIIESYGNRITPVLKKNEGQASTFNAGFTCSEGDSVIFLDADDMLLPHTAAAVASVFESEPNVAKVQYRLDLVDSDGNPIGRQTPPAELDMPEGDLRDRMLRFPDDVRTPPTSGNAFSAAALRRMLPIPSTLYQATGADQYLHNLAPLYGLVRVLAERGGRYRVHETNHYYASGVSTKQIRHVIMCSADNHDCLAKHANELRLPNAPHRGADILSVTYIANRIASKKLEPDKHPFQDDNMLKLARLGIIAASRRVDVSRRVRAVYMLWFIAVATLPRSATRWLVSQAFHVERRGVLGKLV